MPTVDNILSDISTPISTPYSKRASIAKEMLLKTYHLLYFLIKLYKVELKKNKLMYQLLSIDVGYR